MEPIRIQPKRVKKNLCLAALICIIGFSGCSGPRYFDLHLAPGKDRLPENIDKVLRIEDIHSNEVYWTQRMAFRSSPYRVEYFTFRQWARRPGEMVQNAILLYYRNRNIFRKVLAEYSSIEPDIDLKASIYSMEMVKGENQWYVSFAMDLEFIDHRKEQVILTHSFSRKEPVRARKPVLLAGKISKILEEELARAAEKLSEKL